MIVAYLTYYVLSKISGNTGFPHLLPCPKSQPPCVFGGCKNSLSFPPTLREMSATLEMIEPDLQKQATLRESTKSVVAEGSEDEVPQGPMAFKISKKIKDRYIYGKIWRVDFPPSKNNGPILILGVCSADLCLKDCKVSKFGNEDRRYRDNEPLLRLEYNTRS